MSAATIKTRVTRIQHRFRQKVAADFDTWVKTLTSDEARAILEFVDCLDTQGDEAAGARLEPDEPEWMPVLCRFMEARRV